MNCHSACVFLRHEANGRSRGQTKFGVGAIMTSKIINKSRIQLIANSNIISGVSLGLVSTYCPFSLGFTMARFAHLSASSFSGCESTLAWLGVAATVLAAIAIYDARKSTKSLMVMAATIFAMLGVLVSLTV
jgi:hypothetical protein